MKKIKGILSIFLAVVMMFSMVPLSAILANARSGNVDVEFEFNRDSYNLGDPVVVSVTAINTTDEIQSMKFDFSPKDEYMFNFDEELVIKNVPSGGSKTEEYIFYVTEDDYRSFFDKIGDFFRSFSYIFKSFDEKISVSVNGTNRSIGVDWNKITSDDCYIMRFDLNYPDSDYVNPIAVIKGENAVEPTDPIRETFFFGDWYVDAEGTEKFDFSQPLASDVTLYAKWFDDSYCINSAEVNPYAYAASLNLSVETACTAVVSILDNNTKEFLFSDSLSINSASENVSVEVGLTSDLPQYFYFNVDLVDGDGDPLCPTYKSNRNTIEYEEFMEKTVYDFDSDLVLNFDDSYDNNFAVLNEMVERFDDEDDTNVFNLEESDIENDVYQFDNIDYELLDTVVGDILFVDYEEGFFITVESFMIVGTSIIIIASEEEIISDYFSYIKVDKEVDPRTYEQQILPTYSVKVDENGNEARSGVYPKGKQPRLSIADIEETIYGLNFKLPIEIELENKEKTQRGKFEGHIGLEIKPTIVIKYDVRWGDDYYEIGVSLETITSTEAKLIYENNNGATEENVTEEEMVGYVDEIPLGEISIPFGVTGLGAEVELTVGLSLKFSANAHFKSTTTTVLSVSYDSENGKKTSKTENTEKELTVGGAIEVKIGPQLKESITFLGDFVKLSLVQEAGICLEIKADFTVYQDPDATQIHSCFFCASGDLKVFFVVSVELTYELTKHIKGKPFEGKLYEFENHIAKCHVSSETGFGWGDCKNKAYRTTYKVLDIDGSQITNCQLKIFKGSELVKEGNADLYVHLQNGNYKVSAYRNGVVIANKNFEVDSQAQLVTLQVSDDTGYLSGYVANAADNNFISGASIKIYYRNGNLKDSLTSNSSGKYEKELPVGEYTMNISAPGYIPFKVNVGIEKDLTTYVETLLLVNGDPNQRGNIGGKIINSVTGINLSEVSIKVRSGWNVLDGDVVTTTTTNSSGNYSLSLPLGNYTLELQKEDYVTTHINVVVTESDMMNQNGSMNPEGSEEIPEGDLRIILRWGPNPSDLDSHLVGPAAVGSGRFHTYYSNPSYDYNGVKYADLDRDDTSSYGPETTTIYKQNDSGKYTFLVHDYSYRNNSGSSSLSNSGAVVEVYSGDVLCAIYNVPANSTGTVWTVFTYDSATRQLTPINTMSNQSNAGSVGSNVSVY